ncbi:restriction endonuclease subunit S [Streptomyces sp. NPDC052299]|uniref:restriction endonuclease subunit S n=1 Tax=Streptomyces sp. NPDC052299 TaxID=3155054 RepID=UPI00342CD034
MSEWVRVPLDSLLAEPLRNGVSYPSKLRGSGIPMVNMGEAFAYDVIRDQECELVPLTEREQDRFLLEEGDLLFVRQSLVYSGAGRCVLVDSGTGPRTWESHLIRARLDKRLSDPRFVYYYFRSPQGRSNMETIVTQVAAAGIRGSDLKKLEIPHPTLSQQRGIADALRALDDKIAVNERIATTAVEMTDAVFLHAAGHLGFGEETFGSIATVMGGGTPSTKVEEFWGGDISWTTPSDVTALPSPYLFETSRRITETGLESCSSQLYPAHSIFMTSRATIGSFALPQIPAAVNQGFIVVLPPNDDMRWWLFHEMRSRVDEMISLANGSTFLELSRKNFKAMRIRLPGAGEVAAFAQKVAPLHATAAHVADENRTLVSLRDALLPQLMSGRLRVRDAEKIVEDHA